MIMMKKLGLALCSSHEPIHQIIVSSLAAFTYPAYHIHLSPSLTDIIRLASRALDRRLCSRMMLKALGYGLLLL